MILWRWWSEEEGECSLGRVKSKTGQDKVVEMSRDSLGEEKGNNVTWDCPAVAASCHYCYCRDKAWDVGGMEMEMRNKKQQGPPTVGAAEAQIFPGLFRNQLAVLVIGEREIRWRLWGDLALCCACCAVTRVSV